MLFGLLILLAIVLSFAIGWYMPSSNQLTYQDPGVFLELNKINRNLSDHILNTKTGLYDRLSATNRTHRAVDGIIADDKQPKGL